MCHDHLSTVAHGDPETPAQANSPGLGGLEDGTNRVPSELAPSSGL